MSVSEPTLSSSVKQVTPILNFVKNNIEEHEFPLFHVVSQTYVEKEVFTVLTISPEDVKRPTGCLWAMSETPNG